MPDRDIAKDAETTAEHLANAIQKHEDISPFIREIIDERNALKSNSNQGQYQDYLKDLNDDANKILNKDDKSRSSLSGLEIKDKSSEDVPKVLVRLPDAIKEEFAYGKDNDQLQSKTRDFGDGYIEQHEYKYDAAGKMTFENVSSTDGENKLIEYDTVTEKIKSENIQKAGVTTYNVYDISNDKLQTKDVTSPPDSDFPGGYKQHHVYSYNNLGNNSNNIKPENLKPENLKLISEIITSPDNVTFVMYDSDEKRVSAQTTSQDGTITNTVYAANENRDHEDIINPNDGSKIHISYDVKTNKPLSKSIFCPGKPDEYMDYDSHADKWKLRH